MKIGICVNWREEEKLAAIAASGADYVELVLNSFEDATEAELTSLAEKLVALGLTVEAYNGMFPWRGIRVTGAEVDPARIKAYLETVLSKSAPFGKGVIVFGSSGARKMQEGDQRGAAQKDLFRLFREDMIPALEKYDRTVVIEPLNMKEDNLINTVADGMMYVDTLQSPHIRQLVDFYHAGVLEEDLEDYGRYARAIMHCHIASVKNDRHAPLPGDGDEAFYARVFSVLKAIGYEGGVSVEGSWGKNFAEEVKASVALLKSYL